MVNTKMKTFISILSGILFLIFVTVWGIVSHAQTEITAREQFIAVCPAEAEIKHHCQTVGRADTMTVLECRGLREEMTRAGCGIQEYRTLADRALTQVEVTVRQGSTCAGEATVTRGREVRTFNVWPCRWEHTKQGFELIRLDEIGPGTIRRNSELPRSRHDKGDIGEIDIGRTETPRIDGE